MLEVHGIDLAEAFPPRRLTPARQLAVYASVDERDQSVGDERVEWNHSINRRVGQRGVGQQLECDWEIGIANVRDCGQEVDLA